MLKCDIIQLLLRHEICPGWSHFCLWEGVASFDLAVQTFPSVWGQIKTVMSSESHYCSTVGPLPRQDTSGLDLHQEKGRMGYVRFADETKKVLTSSAPLNIHKKKCTLTVCQSMLSSKATGSVGASTYTHHFSAMFFLNKTKFDKTL